MTKVHPNAHFSFTNASKLTRKLSSVNKSSVAAVAAVADDHAGGANANAAVLTVWKKSLLLSCSGFTVFDSKGNLVFRVDNYVAANRAEIVLMDASGKPLLTIRRKRLSLAGDNWLVFDGDSAANPRFTAKKQANFINTRSLARVSSGRSSPASSPPLSPSSPSSSSNCRNVVYEVEGSYQQRCCAVYDQQRRKVAEIKQKEAAVGGVAFGGDVFRLVVQPEIDTPVAMALVVLLDQMYGSS